MERVGTRSERDAWVGLLAETGSVRGRSSSAGRDMLRCGAGHPCACLCGDGASAAIYSRDVRVQIRGSHACVCSDLASEVSNGRVEG
jgi:hypothetical protein